MLINLVATASLLQVGRQKAVLVERRVEYRLLYGDKSTGPACEGLDLLNVLQVHEHRCARRCSRACT
jgi:hypothetical protein